MVTPSEGCRKISTKGRRTRGMETINRFLVRGREAKYTAKNKIRKGRTISAGCRVKFPI
jgi:hypothetical protein